MFYQDLINVPPTLDFEASSLNRESSYPISVGIVSGGKTFYRLIKPKPEWTEWSTRSEKIHGLTRDEIVAIGSPVEQVVSDITGFLQGQSTVYSDCPEWEAVWARKLGLNIKFRDVRSLITPSNEARLSEVVAGCIKTKNLKPHNALDDALMLSYVLAARNNYC